MIGHFKADYRYTTTDVRISHITAFITPHSGYIRTVPNGSEVPISSRTISNYFELFRTICFLCPAYHRTVPNGSEVAYVIWAPLLGWDKFRLDWFKQSYFSILLKTVFIPSRACNITHVMCTLSIVLLFYWVIKIRLCQENGKYSSTANGRSHIESSSKQKVSYTFVHIQTTFKSGESEVRKLEVVTWLHQSMTRRPWTERAGT